MDGDLHLHPKLVWLEWILYPLGAVLLAAVLALVFCKAFLYLIYALQRR